MTFQRIGLKACSAAPKQKKEKKQKKAKQGKEKKTKGMVNRMSL